MSDPTPTGDDEWIAETARGLIVKFRDAGYMRVGTPQTAINDVAATLREAIARGRKTKVRRVERTPFSIEE